MTLLLFGRQPKNVLIKVSGTNDVKKHGNSVNNFYMGFYGMLVAVSTIALFGGAWTLLMYMVPKSVRLFCSSMTRYYRTILKQLIGTSTSRKTIDHSHGSSFTFLHVHGRWHNNKPVSSLIYSHAKLADSSLDSVKT